MIYDQLIKILAEEGIKPMKVIGEKADPYKHEVIKQVENKEERGKIIEEVQRGYMFKDKVIRPSKVIISGGIKNE